MVATAGRSDTSIFATGENANDSPHRPILGSLSYLQNLSERINPFSTFIMWPGCRDYETLLGNLHISEYASIAELNELAEKIDGLADCDYDKLGAVLESESCMAVAEILEIIVELDSFNLLEGIDTDCAIGEYFAEVGDLLHGIPDHIQRYFDFESYGRDIRLELNTCLTSYGLVIDNR